MAWQAAAGNSHGHRQNFPASMSFGRPSKPPLTGDGRRKPGAWPTPERNLRFLVPRQGSERTFTCGDEFAARRMAVARKNPDFVSSGRGPKALLTVEGGCSLGACQEHPGAGAGMYPVPKQAAAR